MLEERATEENGMFELAVSITATNYVRACSASVVDLNLYSIPMHLTSDVRRPELVGSVNCGSTWSYSHQASKILCFGKLGTARVVCDLRLAIPGARYGPFHR